ncbi:MAG: hypothetical protein ACXW25_02620 [Rhodospirillales bacterium]
MKVFDAFTSIEPAGGGGGRRIQSAKNPAFEIEIAADGEIPLSPEVILHGQRLETCANSTPTADTRGVAPNGR